MDLSFTVSPDYVPIFFQFLQRGIKLNARVGCSVRSFLLEQLKLSSEFIENRIMTVFLDGRPVDDIDGAVLKAGCTLALSGAMPGLVGATMRRQGFYASLRNGISYKEEECAAREEGIITLKLFNVIAGELGAALLEAGILVNKGDIEEFLKTHSQELGLKCGSACLGGKEIFNHGSLDIDLSGQPILMKLQVRNTGNP